MRRPDGRLQRTTFAGAEPKLNAYLDDYAYLVDALVSVYETTFEPRWIRAALELAEQMIALFWDTQDGGFFYTGNDHETLIARTKDPHDNATPSGNSMAVSAFLRLAKLTGRTDLFEKAERTLKLFRGLMSRSPTAAGQMLVGLDFYLGPVQEIAVVAGGQCDEVVRLLRRPFRPHQVLAAKTSNEDEGPVALLKDRVAQGGVTTTYICENFTCQAPIVGVEALRKALTV
jgi:uncharacterized protein YyaL (SSP411 family)